MCHIDSSKELDPGGYKVDAKAHAYVDQLSRIDAADAGQFLNVGVDTRENGRAGTFIQKDRSIIHCHATRPGVEIMGISEACAQYDWLTGLQWKTIAPDRDRRGGLGGSHHHRVCHLAAPGIRDARGHFGILCQKRGQTDLHHDP